MNTSTITWSIVTLAVVLGGWYFWSSKPYSYAPSTMTEAPLSDIESTAVTSTTSAIQTGAAETTTPPSGNSGISTLALGSSAGLGQYLVAENGMTLYTSTGDKAGVSNCTGSCVTNWPPYTTTVQRALSVQAGIGGKVGTTARADGSQQVTYKGMPLYFWVGDTKAGETTGNGVGSFLVARP